MGIDQKGVFLTMYLFGIITIFRTANEQDILRLNE